MVKQDLRCIETGGFVFQIATPQYRFLLLDSLFAPFSTTALINSVRNVIFR